MKTFGLTFSVKLRYLVALIFLLLLSLWEFVELGPIFLPFPGNGFDIFFAIFTGMFYLFVLCMVVWLMDMLYNSSKTRLIFDDHAFRLVSIHWMPGFVLGPLKPFVLEYDQIKFVGTGYLPGNVEILKTNGKRFKFYPSLFAKNFGEEILSELRQRLPAECFETGRDVSAVVRDWARKQRLWQIFMAFYFVAVMPFYLFAAPLPWRAWFIHAWDVKTTLSGLEFIDTHSPDGKGGFWVLASRSLTNYRVYHYTDKSKQSWDVPSKKQDDYIWRVSGDENGNPIVWLEDGVLAYDGQNWKPVPYQTSLGKLLISDLVVSGARARGTAYKGKQSSLQEVDAVSGKLSEIPLPQEAVQAGWGIASQIKQAPNGDVMVMFSDKTQKRVYLLAPDNHWRAQTYSLPVSDKWDMDISLAADGSLWVLATSSPPDFESYTVQKITPNGQILTTNLPAPENQHNKLDYRDLTADSRGRIWVSGGFPGFISAFSPQWDGDAVELVRYTQDNSNYQEELSFNGLYADSNRTLWTFRSAIAALDTSQAELPQPLPDWLVFAFQPGVLVVWSTIFLFILAVSGLIIKIQSYRFRRNIN